MTVTFDGGRITSDDGVVLLAEAERRLGLADKLAAVITDGRDRGVAPQLPGARRTAPNWHADGRDHQCDLLESLDDRG